MKRHEVLGIDTNTVEGMKKLFTLNCEDIKDSFSPHVCKYAGANTIDCAKCKAERLFEEVTVKLVQRGTTYDDFNKAYNDWIDYYGKDNYTNERFCDWLCQEIHVPVKVIYG